MQQLALTADCEELLLAGEEDEARKVCVVPCTDAGEKCKDGSGPTLLSTVLSGFTHKVCISEYIICQLPSTAAKISTGQNSMRARGNGMGSDRDGQEI